MNKVLIVRPLSIVDVWQQEFESFADPETIQYSCADTEFALRLYHIFNNWFDKFPPKHRWIVEYIESPAAVYLGIMKYNGVPIDEKLMLRRKEEAAIAAPMLLRAICMKTWDCRWIILL